jgi:hypothetical protein
MFTLLYCLSAKGQADLADATQINPFIGDDLATKRFPKAVSNSKGEIAAIWSDDRNGRHQLFLQFTDASRDLVGTNINLTPGEEIEEREYDLLALPDDNFLVTWSSGESFNSTIKYAIYAPDGTMVMAPVEVENGPDDRGSRYPAIAMYDETTFVMSFVPYRFSEETIDVQLFSTAGGAVSDRVSLDTLTGSGDFEFSDVLVTADKQILVAFQRPVGFIDNNVGYALLDTDLNILRRNRRLNPTNGEAIHPSCVEVPDGNLAVFWLDFTDAFGGETYGQLIEPDGDRVGTAKRIGLNDGQVISNQYPWPIRNGDRLALSNFPAVNKLTTLNDDLEPLATIDFEGFRCYPVAMGNGYGAVFPQGLRFATTFASTQFVVLQRNDNEYQLNTDEFSFGERFREWAFREDGTGVVLWTNIQNGDEVTLGQRMNGANERVGDPFVVSTGSTNGHKIALADNGSFAIFYQEFEDFMTFYYLAFFDGAGNLIRRRPMGDTGGTAVLEDSRGVEYNPASNQYLFWAREFNNEVSQLRVRRTTISGDFVGSARTVLSEGGIGTFRWVVRDNGEYVVAYRKLDGFSDQDVFLAVLSQNGQLQTGPFQFNETDDIVANNSHEIWESSNGTIWARYQYDGNNVGPDQLSSPVVFRSFSPENVLGNEILMDRNGNIRDRFSYRNGLWFWVERSGDIYQRRYSPTLDTFSERLFIPEADLRRDFQFIRQGNEMTILFREARTPGRNYDLFRFVTTDHDQDGFFDILDCDDASPTVFPGAAEIINNGIDEDCDGRDSTQMTTTTIEPFGSEVLVYPNPVSDILRIQTDPSISYQAILRDMLGQTVIQETNSNTLNLAYLQPGIYTLELRRLDKRGRYVSRVVLTSKR